MGHRQPYLTGMSGEAIREGQFVTFRHTSVTENNLFVAGIQYDATFPFGEPVIGVATNSVSRAGEPVGIRTMFGGTCSCILKNAAGPFPPGIPVFSTADGYAILGQEFGAQIPVGFTMERTSHEAGERIEVQLVRMFQVSIKFGT